MIPNNEELRDTLVGDLMPVTFEDMTYNKNIILEMEDSRVGTFYNFEGTLVEECKYPTLTALAKDWIRTRDSLGVFKKTYYTDDNLLSKLRIRFPYIKNIYLKDLEI